MTRLSFYGAFGGLSSHTRYGESVSSTFKSSPDTGKNIMSEKTTGLLGVRIDINEQTLC